MRGPATPIACILLATAGLGAVRGDALPVEAPASQSAAPSGAQSRTFDFHDTPAEEVLAFIAQSYGCIFVKRYPLQGRISATTGPLTETQAIAKLKDLLVPLGYTLVESPGTAQPEQRVFRIITLLESRINDRIRTAAVTIGTDPGKIDLSDSARWIIHVLPLEHGDLATEVSGDDPEIIVEATIYGGHPTAVIMGPAAKVRQTAEKLVTLEQARRAQSTLKTRKLKYAFADRGALMVNTLFGAVACPESPVYASYDARTGLVVLVGPTSQVTEALAALDKLDRPGDNAATQKSNSPESQAAGGSRPAERAPGADSAPSLDIEMENWLQLRRLKQLGG